MFFLIESYYNKISQSYARAKTELHVFVWPLFTILVLVLGKQKSGNYNKTANSCVPYVFNNSGLNQRFGGFLHPTKIMNF